MSNVGKWDQRYRGLSRGRPVEYGHGGATYRLGAEWLAGCALVEDWGCGMGGFGPYRSPLPLVGVDGSATPFADVVADLAEYRSRVPGVFMRHVLEHDYRWADILDNAVRSFTERMFLAVFTPNAARTHVVYENEALGVPNISFAADDLADRLAGVPFAVDTVQSDTEFGVERVYRIER